MMSEQNSTEEEYLKKHLDNISKTKSNDNSTTNVLPTDAVRFADIHYFAFDAKLFPCGIFYPPGTTIQIRAAEVKEIQYYSMVENGNLYDLNEKLNYVLSSCVRIKYSDGRIGSYLELKDPDRYFITFIIRELTFQKGNSLETPPVTCLCGNDVKIELKRDNFIFYKINEMLEKYFNVDLRCFTFNIKNGYTYNLAPPTIGVSKSFTEYIVDIYGKKGKLDFSFLKIVPFLLVDKNSITIGNIKSELEKYQKMDSKSFQFLNDAVSKLTFGIEKLHKQCNKCGEDVRTDMIFPERYGDIFVIPGAFEEFIEE